MITLATVPVLHVSDDPSNSGCFRPINPAPAPNAGFTERQTVCFHKPPGSGWILRIDDEPLADIGVDGISAWTWTPGFYAGEVTAELEASDGSVRATFLLDVSPDPTKIGRDVFSQMIRDLCREDPALVFGSEPAKAVMGELGRTDDPLVAFARLRLYGPKLVRALFAISSRPIQTLRSTRERVPFHAARRADHLTVLTALRDRNAVRLLVDAERNAATAAVELAQLSVPRTESHLDGAANRCVTALAVAVTRRIRAVRRSLERLSERAEPSDTRTALASRWPARKRFLSGMEQQIAEILSVSPFSVVTRQEVMAAGLNAAAAHPLYSRAHNLAWRILRTGIFDNLSDERLWISPTWEIYERWCFVKLAAVLRACRPNLKWERSKAHSSGAIMAWIGSDEETTVEFLLQPTFTAWDRSSGKEYRSLSGDLVPDFVLTKGGKETRFVVLDAKYRAARLNVLDGMRSAHLYHDALRYRGQRPDLSLLLVPASYGVDWLHTSEFQQDHGVGAHILNADVAWEAAALTLLLRLV